MKKIFKAMSALMLVATCLVIFVDLVAATNFQLSGRITNQSGNPLAGSTIDVIDPFTSAVVASTSTDSTGYYILTVAGGAYNVRVTPPAGSGFGSVIALNRSVNSDGVLDFILVPSGAIGLSGRVLDALGNGVANQRIILTPAGSSPGVTTTTDATGAYSFQVSPGNYSIGMGGGAVDPSINLPPNYALFVTTPLGLTQNTILDVPLPLKRVGVHVQDPGGNPVGNVGIGTNQAFNNNLMLGALAAQGVSDYGVSSPASVTDASGDVTLWLFPTEPGGQTYTFVARPPAGSGFAITSLLGVQFATNTSMTITLAVPVTLSGRVLDALGNGVANQRIILTPAGSSPGVTTTTDATGAYSFQVSPGNYSIGMGGGAVDPSINLPPNYALFVTTPLGLTQNTILDVPLPLKRVGVHVQDPGGNPVGNVGIGTNQAFNNNLMLGALAAQGVSDYGVSSPASVTDASGDVTLWLFPTEPGGQTYTFVARPPAVSPFATFALQNVAIASDRSIIIALQFVHAPPITSASVAPSPDARGQYADPATITISASAFAGFSVAATYYSIDSGPTQTYSTPFNVSGPGPHSIKYWSVDSGGVYEIANTLDITIASNHPPVARCKNVTKPAGADCSAVVNPQEVDDGSSDPDGDALTLSLSPAGPFGLGTTSVTLTVTDSKGASSTCTATVTVANPAPVVTITGPSSGAIFAVGTPVSFNGTFSDTGGGAHTAQWMFDGIAQAGTINESTGGVSVVFTFATVGVYMVKLTVLDSCGGAGAANTVGGLDAMVVLYDPNAGFVTGGGWIDSPAGAYAPDTTLTGRASFGFVSKYQRGASVPTGQTEFQFRVANFNFHSTAYDWLVVAGAKAQYKGTGTVNGSGDYGFILTAIDGQINGGGGVDKFRIKIWNKVTGNVVYDNQLGAADGADPSTALGGGSIVIHN